MKQDTANQVILATSSKHELNGKLCTLPRWLAGTGPLVGGPFGNFWHRPCSGAHNTEASDSIGHTNHSSDKQQKP
jgi:hypothetical protein